MTQYTPEIGQMLFGQPTQQFECPPIMDAAINYLREELDRVLWNRMQKGTPMESPFSNSGATFDTEGLSIHAYSWGDDNQPWNLKCGHVEVSWYKYAGRGMSANKLMTPDDVSEFMNKALAIIHKCDSSEFEEDGQKFNYCGDEF